MNRLESILRKVGQDLSHHQIAKFWKMPEAMEKTPCDFMGFDKVGKVILIEAKMVNRKSLPIGKSPGLRPHQWIALKDAFRAGGHSLVIWARDEEVSVAPWWTIEYAAGSRKSVCWDDIPGDYKIDLTTSGVSQLLEAHLTRNISKLNG